jgi:hypothetical protein
VSGAILGWGVDLGHEASTAAKLFDDPAWYGAGGDNGVTWDIYCYGPGHTYMALLLCRSVVCRDPEDGDNSVQKFLDVTLSASGYPVMKSQPTPAEVDILKEIVQVVRPDRETVDLILQPLLLPAD